MRKRITLLLLSAVCLIVIAALMLFNQIRYDVTVYKNQPEKPRIRPDYSNLVIPPDIAPMNFQIMEKGERFLVKLFTGPGDTVFVRSRSSSIEIPEKSWKKLIREARDRDLSYEIYVYQKAWIRYRRFSNHVAEEPIDRYVMYRFFRPNYRIQKEMQLIQRDLESYHESVVMTTRSTTSCVNCHTFNRNNPDQMLFHIRWGDAAGTIIAAGDSLRKVDTRTDFNQSPGTYPSWHPDGRVVAFSVNKVRQFFHALNLSRDVIDLASDIILFHTDSNKVTVNPNIASPEYMETYPNWSPDGRTLFFCRAPQIDSDFDLERTYREISYDLMKISYDADTGEFGTPEVLISASESHISCSQPRVSPDGKYILFSGANYGNFPILLGSSDLYLYNLQSGRYHRIAVNSNAPEGHHAWSENSRWIVFTSRRDNGLFTRLYFSHMDASGHFSKPFILPLKNPESYQTLFQTFSVPELITEPPHWHARQFLETALNPEKSLKARLDKSSSHADKQEPVPSEPVGSESGEVL